MLGVSSHTPSLLSMPHVPQEPRRFTQLDPTSRKANNVERRARPSKRSLGSASLPVQGCILTHFAPRLSGLRCVRPAPAASQMVAAGGRVCRDAEGRTLDDDG
ncbi:hypothetical protein TraAM80_04575 [Trypanosoma rangeli]|uniref:Uncharacterized protein n=1 Tax=Trypanosoma rangeli TaxID=5698 RepID=A0A3R7NEN6_TRYRA|nr:uncharacterized protein TraAM80_04575 [Trypanosoma rangeli]RNF05376.1 hypothetical protein TraAM80_04575 [Trypanosoma rangeli]|eukprot:RNF05376.1 hypothetical protein TraAM80_04575 [Trypanosoma rangeli]